MSPWWGIRDDLVRTYCNCIRFKQKVIWDDGVQCSALAFVRHVNVFNCRLVAFHAIIPGSKSTFSVLMIRRRVTCLHYLIYRGRCAALRSAFSTVRRAKDSYDPTNLRNIAVVAHIGRNTS